MHAKKSNRIFPAIGLILLGMMFLMDVGTLWPMFILVPGLIMLWIAVAGGKAGAASMSIPGMITTGTGALLFIQNITGYWESWAYAWTLYGIFLGMGFMLMGQQFDDPGLHNVGRGFARAGLIAFFVFAFFFEVILGISGGFGALTPLALIGLGLYLLTRGVGEERLHMLLGSNQAKVKNKPKRNEDQLFTGPVIYGTRVTSRDSSRLSRDSESSEHS